MIVSSFQPASAAVTYTLGEEVDLLDASFYSGQPEDGSDTSGRWAFQGRLSNDGGTVTFLAVNVASFQLAFFTVDVDDPASWRRWSQDVSVTPSGPIYWTPDGLSMVGGRWYLPAGSSQFVEHRVHGVLMNDVSFTYLPADNWAVSIYTPGAPDDLIAVPVLANGLEDLGREPVILTDFAAGDVSPDWPHVSPDGSMVAFADYHGAPVGSPDVSDVYVLKNVPAIMAAPKRPGTWISTLAPTSLADPNIVAIRSTESVNFAHCPFFSQDQTHVIYCEDRNNVFRNESFFGTIFSSDFDLMISSTDGTGEDFRFTRPGNQFFPITTGGGTRVLYVKEVDGAAFHLFITTINVVTDVAGTVVGDPAENDILVAEIQQAEDTCGTTVTVPADTIIDFPAGVDQAISMTTPISPATEAELPPDTQGLPVIREFGPEGTTFSKPITITISYTDGEVMGLDEANLRIFLFNTVSGKYDIEITEGLTRDLVNNTISFEVDHFSKFGLGGSLDTDQDGEPDSVDTDDDDDGVLDVEDPHPLDTDDDGIDNIDDPDDDCDGIPDGDDTALLDTDDDGLANAIDDDDDNDGVADGLDVYLFDTDNDGVRNDVSDDDDGDGLSDNAERFVHHTNSLDTDSDGDGLDDRNEIAFGLDPLNPGQGAPLPLAPLPIAATVLLAATLWQSVRRKRS